MLDHANANGYSVWLSVCLSCAWFTPKRLKVSNLGTVWYVCKTHYGFCSSIGVLMLDVLLHYGRTEALTTNNDNYRRDYDYNNILWFITKFN